MDAANVITSSDFLLKATCFSIIPRFWHFFQGKQYGKNQKGINQKGIHQVVIPHPRDGPANAAGSNPWHSHLIRNRTWRLVVEDIGTSGEAQREILAAFGATPFDLTQDLGGGLQTEQVSVLYRTLKGNSLPPQIAQELTVGKMRE